MTAPESDRCDVAVIGGGPAGMAAAEMMLAAGLRVTLIDEQQRLGGQILRQPPVQFSVAGWLTGAAYRAIKQQLQRTERQDPHFLGGTSVAGLFAEEDGFTLWLSGNHAMRRLKARRVLLATGCYDLPAALPGWTLPGVMTVGGIQAALKAQQLIVGDQILLAGTHPLMLILAQQILAAGGQVAAVLLAQHRRVLLRLMRHPLLMLRHWRPLVEMASAILALRRAGVPIRFGTTLCAIEGDEAVSGARVATVAADGSVGPAVDGIACDRVGLGFGFLPQSELARSAGAAASWSAPVGGWAIDHDPDMQSTLPGLYVAGEVAGVGGAGVALLEGKLAAIGILRGLGVAVAASAGAGWRRQRDRRRRFATLLASLSSPHPVLAQLARPETILCRCEQVRFGALDRLLEGEVAITDASAAKLQSRIGMGLCQGRNCEFGLLCRLSAASGRDIAAMTGFTARFPVKPIPIGDLLDIDP